MADLTITAVRPTATTRFELVVYGATVAVGDVLYFDTTDLEWKLADCDDTQATSQAGCLAMTPGVDGGYGIVATGGSVVLVGASMTAGDSQVLSGTAGKIQQDADLASNDWIVQIGRAESSVQIKLAFDSLGIQVP